jgi:hypothetical protein
MLAAFAAVQCRAAFRKCRHCTNLGDAMPFAADPNEAWHLMETHMQLTRTRRGKAYKAWLMARGGGTARPDLAAIESGAALLMRTAVRLRLEREYSPRGVVSLHAPLAGGGSLTIEDLLPDTADPAQEASRRQIRALAAHDAAAWLPGLRRTERVALLAVDLGLPFGNPRVEKAAHGANPRTLVRAYERLMYTLAARVRAAYPREDGAAVRALVFETAAAMHNAVRAWAQTDPHCAALLALAPRRARRKGKRE